MKIHKLINDLVWGATCPDVLSSKEMCDTVVQYLSVSMLKRVCINDTGESDAFYIGTYIQSAHTELVERLLLGKKRLKLKR
jgi:hypothetical protein